MSFASIIGAISGFMYSKLLIVILNHFGERENH